jgi:hypothetical protein
MEGRIERDDGAAEGLSAPTLSPVVASVGTEPCDPVAGVGVEQGIALAAPFDRDRGTVEGKAFAIPTGIHQRNRDLVPWRSAAAADPMGAGA